MIVEGGFKDDGVCGGEGGDESGEGDEDDGGGEGEHGDECVKLSTNVTLR